MVLPADSKSLNPDAQLSWNMHPRNPGLADELYASNPCIKNGASQEIYLKDIPEIKIVAFLG
jgi:hypothetical protein